MCSEYKLYFLEHNITNPKIHLIKAGFTSTKMIPKNSIRIFSILLMMFDFLKLEKR